MNYLNNYATYFGFDKNNNFAVACYEQNSIKELEKALDSEPDEIDMNEWNISAEQWVQGIWSAYMEKINE